MDSIDEQLVELLLEDANRTSSELAKLLNVSAPTVRRRINNLLKNNMIHMIALPVHENIGWTVTALIALNVLGDKIKPVLTTLGQNKQIRWAAATSGRFDVLIVVWLSSTEELYEFLEQNILSLDGVIHAESFIALHTEKQL